MATRNEWSARKGRSSSWLYKPTRHAIYHRDGHACVYCHKGVEDGVVLAVDHILAKDFGGSNDPENLVSACWSCNSAKSAMTVKGWAAYCARKGIKVNWTAIRKQAARPLDRAEGKRLAGLAKKGTFAAKKAA